MRIEIDVREEEMVRSQKLHMGLTPSRERSLKTMFIILACLLPPAAYVVRNTHDSPGPLFDMLAPVLPGLMISVLVSVVLFWVFVPRRLRAQYRRTKDLHQGVVLEFHGEGLRYRDKYSESDLPWEQLTKWKEDEELILVYRLNDTYFILPKRCLSGAADLAQLLGLLQEKLGSASR